MEIRQLKYFLEVARELNFSKASQHLFVTQSTLSQQISRLEQEVGMPLFDRNSHEVWLTEAGRELVPYAQKTVNAAKACADHMTDLREMLTGELNIGVTFSFSNIMAETLIAFIHAYPHVKLNIVYRSMQELMDGLKRRELDLVLAFRPLKHDKAIDSRAIFSNRLAAIVNDQHPLARQQRVKLTDLERYDLILPPRDCRRATPSTTSSRGMTSIFTSWWRSTTSMSSLTCSTAVSSSRSSPNRPPSPKAA